MTDVLDQMISIYQIVDVRLVSLLKQYRDSRKVIISSLLKR
jgi:hypothetical protein